jgi:hypothetical protein
MQNSGTYKTMKQSSIPLDNQTLQDSYIAVPTVLQRVY